MIGKGTSLEKRLDRNKSMMIIMRFLLTMNVTE